MTIRLRKNSKNSMKNSIGILQIKIHTNKRRYLLYFSDATATCGPWPDRESGCNVSCHLLHFANLLFPAPEDLIRRHLSIAFMGDPLLFTHLHHFGITLRGSVSIYAC